MIGCLKGTVIETNESKILMLTASGVGYEIFFSSSDCSQFCPGTDALIHTTNIIKETSNELYGFKNSDEKKIFELLISVKGVGQSQPFQWFLQLVQRILFKLS